MNIKASSFLSSAQALSFYSLLLGRVHFWPNVWFPTRTKHMTHFRNDRPHANLRITTILRISMLIFLGPNLIFIWGTFF